MPTVPELKSKLNALGAKGYATLKKTELEAMLATFVPVALAEPVVEGDILKASYWAKTKAFKAIKDKETQGKYYRRMNASPEVLQLVDLESKPFGTESEKIISEIFNLGPRTSTENDGTLNGVKIEIKTARYWAGKDDCTWQHLEPDHDYAIVLCVLLGFDGWKVWGIKKSVLMSAELRNISKEKKSKKPVNFQGKQGWWGKKSNLLPHLTPIRTMEELQAFAASL